MSDRRCWQCSEKGHSARNCDKAGRSRPVKILEAGEPEPTPFFGSCNLLTDPGDGFQKPRKTARPTATRTTLGDYIMPAMDLKNKYQELAENEDTGINVQEEVQRIMHEELQEDHPFQGHVDHPKHPAAHPAPAGRPVPLGPRHGAHHHAQRSTASSPTSRTAGSISCLECGLEAAEEELIANTTEVVKVKVAVDSGSVANVIFPEGLPRDVVVSGNENGHHFTGAGGDPIRRHGSCKTRLKGAR